MVFTITGQSGLMLAIGSFSTNRPQYLAIGSGSGTVLTSDVDLIYENRRDVPTSTTIDGVNREITYIGDWHSIDMSGITLREFGMFTESSINTGSLWNREGFTGVTFDGTNELQIQLKFQTY